jgi:hypothetical protein
MNDDGSVCARGRTVVGVVMATDGNEVDVCINAQVPVMCPRCKSMIRLGIDHPLNECNDAMVHVIMDE